ncbi:MAG: hypothetical protein GY716_22435 [bacterium]|nr:hypothetical protein [bacterium]
MNRTTAVALSIVALACLPALAEEGRVPIFEPIVLDGTAADITGQYVVTRDITAASATPVIRIIGDPAQAQNVEIDLNGFTLTGHPLATAVVEVTDLRSFTLRNGSLTSQFSGVPSPTVGSVSGDVVTVSGAATEEDRVVIESVKASAGDEQIQLIDVNNFAIRGNVIVGVDDVSGSGIEISASNVVSGVISGNVIRDTAIGVDIPTENHSVTIQENHIAAKIDSEAFDSIGIWIQFSKSLIVAENNVVGGGSSIAIWDAEQCKLTCNVLSEGEFSALELIRADDCTISGNSASNKLEGEAPFGGHGLFLDESDRNHIVDNQFNQNQGYGIYFLGTSTGNTYGGNTLRGNTGLPVGTCPFLPAAPICTAPAVCDESALPQTNPGANKSFQNNLTDTRQGPC